MQCVYASREGLPTKHCFTPNQIEDLVGRIRFAAVKVPWHVSGNKTLTHTNKHTVFFVFFSHWTFLCPLFSSVLFCYFGDYCLVRSSRLKHVSTATIRAWRSLLKPSTAFPDIHSTDETKRNGEMVFDILSHIKHTLYHETVFFKPSQFCRLSHL